ncbi:MAG TPA: hypothetical protein VJ180_11820 [Pyrinomonadaceae bacterium]|nr:hypothetical protein [Pyrinomonadaceae bacterium]
MKTVQASGFQRNELFWARSVKAIYAPVVQYFSRALSERLLPHFSNLAPEAERFAEEEFQRLSALPVLYETDSSELAELANDNGVSWYASMAAVRQSVVNLHAVGLRHLFEQQLFDLVSRVPLASRSSANYEKDLKALCKNRIDVKNFNSWPTLEELRLVCHAVKHGAGSAASQLKGLRADLFVNPVVPTLSSLNRPVPVLQPLAGEDIYLREADVEKYAATIENFWNEVSQRLEQMAAGVI